MSDRTLLAWIAWVEVWEREETKTRGEEFRNNQTRSSLGILQRYKGFKDESETDDISIHLVVSK